MTSEHPHDPAEAVQVRWARLALTLAVMAAAWFALNAVMDFSVTRGGGQGLFGLGFLILVPLAVGAVLGVVIQRFWPETGGLRIGLVASVVFLVLSVVTGAGVICVVIAAPLWFPSLVLGGWASNWIVRRAPPVQAATTTLALVIACAAWASDEAGHYPTQQFTIERTVNISTSAEEVWPHLLRLESLSAGEGRPTFSHDILGVPRPVEAIVSGEGVGAVRIGRWSGGVWFEEHIVGWASDRQLDWSFVFPAGSTFASIDQHIDPRGPNVVVQQGGYRLEALADGTTRLRLYTTYSLSTAVNGYAQQWAERILGDVQSNILEIVKSRAESGVDTQGLVLAGDIGANQ